MATTTNYSWETPDDTDLVKDGAAAIRTLGSSIDTTTKALNPSTTLGDIEYRSSTANTNTRLGIGTTGQVLTVSGGVPAWATPSAAAFIGASLTSAAQSIANVTYTALAWNGEDFDTDGFHDNTTNNSRFTVPTGKGGKYLISGIINFSPDNPSGNLRIVNIYKNGSATGDIIFYTNPSGSTSVTFSKVLNLVATDYIQIMGYQNSGGSLELKGTSIFGTGVQFTYLGA